MRTTKSDDRERFRAKRPKTSIPSCAGHSAVRRLVPKFPHCKSDKGNESHESCYLRGYKRGFGLCRSRGFQSRHFLKCLHDPNKYIEVKRELRGDYVDPSPWTDKALEIKSARVRSTMERIPITIPGVTCGRGT